MKSKLNKKKTVLVLILVITAVFISMQSDAFIKELSIKNKIDPVETISMMGSQSIDFSFTAEKQQLDSIGIYITDSNSDTSTGTMIVELMDKDGKSLGQSEKSPVEFRYEERTYFPMKVDLTPGEEYKIIIRSVDINSKSDCTVDTSHVEKYTFYSVRNLVVSLSILIFAGIFILMPIELIQERIGAKRKNFPDLNILLSRIFFAISPFVAYWIVEKSYGISMTKFLGKQLEFAANLNLIVYALILVLLYLIVNRTKYTAILLTVMGFGFGLLNYYLMSARGCPLAATDIESLTTALTVANSYTLTLNLSLVGALAYTVAFTCVLFSLKGYKGLPWKKRVILLVLFCISVFSFKYLLFNTTTLKDNQIKVSVWNPSKNYHKNGSALSFLTTLTYVIVEKPSGYSVSKVNELTADYESDAVNDKNAKQKPNVIVIMNEAFSDLRVNKDFETSEDYMPFVRNLKENTVKGNLYVSIFGGSTANSEFEFLTGNTMAFFPFKAVAFNNFIKEKTPNLTYTLKEEGYVGNQAIHPYINTGYNRNNVYPLLGFDEFLYQDSFKNPDRIRKHISDQANFDFVIEQYEKFKKSSDSPYYTFNVTMQNHGGYTDPPGVVETEVTIEDPALKDAEAELYINLIKKSDEAYENLINYFKNDDRPTVIVTYGDHQPKVHDSFYSQLLGKDLTELNIEESSHMYEVPYFIWANYDIEEEEIDMSANYLSSYMLKIIGSEMTGYDKYLLDLQKKLPVISASCYIGDDGVIHAPDDESSYSELINEYKMIQYNNLFDSKNRINDFYYLKKN